MRSKQAIKQMENNAVTEKGEDTGDTGLDFSAVPQT